MHESSIHTPGSARRSTTTRNASRTVGIAIALLALAACVSRVATPATPVTPATPATPATPVADVVPAHDSFTVASTAVGEARPINVWTPAAYRASPSTRFPVLYMPDGGVDEDFPHVVHTVDSLIARGAVRPVIVVGIPNTQRRRDLTGPTRVAADSAIAPRVGGSAAFRRFVREELVPAIDARYRTTPERAIVGESLAGLFILETFLEDPTLFTHSVAIDPTFRWNAGELVKSAAPRVTALGGAPRSLWLATSRDGDPVAAARLDSLLRAASPAGLRWHIVPRADLMHSNIFRATEAEALADALR